MEWRQSNVIVLCIRSRLIKFAIKNQFNILRYRCSIIVEPGENACQLRVDLLDFSLAPPNGDGTCNTDVISITGSATNVPLLCGENPGQHLITDFAGSTPINIAVKTTSSYTFGRHWNIRITQINCDSPYRGARSFFCFFSYNSINIILNVYIFSAIGLYAILSQFEWHHS